MGEFAIPAELRRFLISGAVTVPHVEAILQLRSNAAQSCDATQLAARLYVRPAKAEILLSDLYALGVTECGDGQPPVYRYAPVTSTLAGLLDQLEQAYTQHLVAVTELIHSAEGRAAHQFADAFRFRKDS